MSEAAVITLLTDFGASEPYVGIMKGVILGIHPRAVIVDLTHEVPPQDIAAASYHLESAWHWFPPRTVHVAVVDPGVGSSRRALAVEAGGHRFVAPDNGLLASVLRALPYRAFAIEPTHALGPSPSATFHGRDVFAPAAARLARGADPSDLGEPVHDPVLVLPQAPRRGGAPRTTRGAASSRRSGPDRDEVSTQVVHVDRFGNLILDVVARRLGDGHDPDAPASWSARIAGRTVDRFVTHYAAAGRALCLLVNSDGRLEIALPGGSAAAELGAGRGTRVVLHRVTPRSR